jgi:tRNA C32,U32 (ribose-2'-O)-methylase TrmJ
MENCTLGPHHAPPPVRPPPVLPLLHGISAMQEPPKCWLVIHSVAKKHNLGTLVRCATAFGVAEVLLVGERSFNTFGAHGADAHVSFRHFESLQAVHAYVHEAGGRLLGIEITEASLDVGTHPFTGPTAFLLGNEGTGLSDTQKQHCDGFVYIPQYGPGTASLNVAVAAGIVLHHFASWANYAEREREGEKFVVAPRPQRKAPRGRVAEAPEVVRARRAEARLAAQAAAAAAVAAPDATTSGQPPSSAD